MSADLKIPKDLLAITAFRRLRDKLENPDLRVSCESAALLVWFLAYREMAYKAEEGGAVGRMNPQDMESLAGEIQSKLRVESLGVEGGKDIAPASGSQPSTFNSQLPEMLLASGFMERDGEDYVCPRFIVSHGVTANRSQGQRGGDMRSFKHGQRAALEESAQLALEIAENARDRYVDPDTGEPLDLDGTRRVLTLIRCCDRALFKNTRPKHGFTEGLIADAARVAKKHTDEEINHVLTYVASKRGHVLLANMTTEKVLPMFGELMPKLA